MTHLSIVGDIPFTPETSVVARLWLPGDTEETTGNSPAFLEDEEEDFRDQIEDKVVKPRRGRRPAPPTGGVETK